MTLSMAVVGTTAKPAGSWTPLTLGSSLTAWFDASDTSTITSSSNAVSQWSDKSGKGYHATQDTAASKPTKGTDYLSFDGGDRLATSISGSSVSQCIAAVFMSEKTGSGNQIGNISGPSALGGLAFRMMDYNNARNLMWIKTGIAEIASGSQSFSRNTVTLVLGNITASTWRLAVNGTASTGTHSITLTSGLTTFIGSHFSADYLTGRLYEVVFASSLSVGDQEKVEGYLAHRWNLTASLPSTHPYKTVKP